MTPYIGFFKNGFFMVVGLELTEERAKFHEADNGVRHRGDSHHRLNGCWNTKKVEGGRDVRSDKRHTH
jgi:hypothetical protein